jgi:CheY-like chemotaxis protein
MIDSHYKPIKILLVEDNEGDVFLTKKAFAKAKIANEIDVATNGETALEMLRNKGQYSDLNKPDIVLLDINLPKMDGKQVLAQMKEDDTLRRIPVVILTSSKAEKDILKSYDLHANSYIVKPLDLKKFHEVVSVIEDFWFSVVTLPKDNEGKKS